MVNWGGLASVMHWFCANDILKCKEVFQYGTGEESRVPVDVVWSFQDAIIRVDGVDLHFSGFEKLFDVGEGEESQVCAVVYAALSIRPAPKNHEVPYGIDVPDIGNGCNDATVWSEQAACDL